MQIMNRKALQRLGLVSTVCVALLTDSAFAQGSDEDINTLRMEVGKAQSKISEAFASYSKAPESVFEKSAGVFATVPAMVQTVKDKLANQRTIFKQRVDKRKNDQLISEDRRKKSLELYQAKLNEVTDLDERCKILVSRTDDFLTKDIPRLKNEFEIDCEDFGKADAKKNLGGNLDKIDAQFRKIFIQIPTTSSDEKKN
jgi:hypothetical protein